ncbi:unnamed protein product [Effrenium voratum]|uniref:Uncharacterized protein n=1 Tax=Effrenium voratum TaxID=2562239 RepID=A0AA36HWP9_9DINO|nr:unnamed protein product [Effrenium voratum]
MGVLESLMEPEYQLYRLQVDCEDVGHAGIARTRTYVIMRHVQTTDCLYDPMDLYEQVREYIMPRARTQPRDYMIATSEEIALEAMSVARSRKLVYRPGLEDLTYLLNEREQGVLDYACAEYRRRFNTDPYMDPNLAVFLGDNPSYALTWSAVSGKALDVQL